MSNYLSWILINIFLPLSPFVLRLFLLLVGGNKKLTFSSIAELPEILFYSIFLCVISLNINMNRIKKVFEHFVRIFLIIILVLDFITLGMVYNNNYGIKTLVYSIIASVVPASIAVIYKFIFIKQDSGDN
jgi:hypothetical protein